MTLIPKLRDQLTQHEAKLQEIADWLQKYVPENAEPDHPVWSAWIRVGGAASECKRAVRDLRGIK